MANFLAHLFPWIGRTKEDRNYSLTKLAVYLLFRRMNVGSLEIVFPTGERLHFCGLQKGPQAVLKINNYKFFALVMFSGDLGFAESYMKSYIETPNLPKLLRLGILNEAPLSDVFKTGWFKRYLNQYYHSLKSNSLAGSSRNIAAHYDLGNKFYSFWLGKMMTYSSGIFVKPGDSLEKAQTRKYYRLAEKLNLLPGDYVLEIGCGWGDFAEIAAREFGCKGLAITLSKEQADYARSRMANSGLSDQVEVRLQDYRNVQGSFDKIVSIEMFEAVGQEFWNDYFAVLKKCLQPNGAIGMQVITIDDAYFQKYQNNPEFIQKYIFPGGMLPSVNSFYKLIDDNKMSLSSSHYFGLSYAETLRRWRREFLKHWLSINNLGFDERFKRMWEYYLSYCEVGFENGQINVGQFIIDQR